MASIVSANADPNHKFMGGSMLVKNPKRSSPIAAPTVRTALRIEFAVVLQLAGICLLAKVFSTGDEAPRPIS